MKPLFLAFLLVAVAIPLRADDWLKNPDFSDGIHDWYGAGTFGGSDSDSSDPFASPAAAPKGLTFKLRPDWIKETQDFTPQGPSAVVKVTYVVSQGTTLSARDEDYKNVPDRIGWDHWLPVDVKPGSGVIFISNLTTERGTYVPFHPDLQTDKEQFAFLKLEGQTPGAQMTVALCFPPGEGTIIVHGISITGQ